MKLLRIQSSNKNEIFELIDILDSIVEFNSDIRQFNYLISFLDGSADKNFKGSFNDFLKSINNAEIGIILKFDSLREKILELFQIYDLLLLIDRDFNKLDKSEIENENVLHEKVFVTIAYFDGGFWEITSRDNFLTEFLSKKFVHS